MGVCIYLSTVYEANEPSLSLSADGLSRRCHADYDPPGLVRSAVARRRHYPPFWSTSNPSLAGELWPKRSRQFKYMGHNRYRGHNGDSTTFVPKPEAGDQSADGSANPR